MLKCMAVMSCAEDCATLVCSLRLSRYVLDAKRRLPAAPVCSGRSSRPAASELVARYAYASQYARDQIWRKVCLCATQYARARRQAMSKLRTDCKVCLCSPVCSGLVLLLPPRARVLGWEHRPATSNPAGKGGRVGEKVIRVWNPVQKLKSTKGGA